MIKNEMLGDDIADDIKLFLDEMKKEDIDRRSLGEFVTVAKKRCWNYYYGVMT